MRLRLKLPFAFEKCTPQARRDRHFPSMDVVYNVYTWNVHLSL